MLETTKFIYSKTIAWQVEPVNDFVYIYNIERGNFIILEDVSKEIWLMIKKDNCLKDIIECISLQYEIEYRDIEEDITDAINNLIKEGALEIYE